MDEIARILTCDSDESEERKCGDPVAHSPDQSSEETEDEPGVLPVSPSCHLSVTSKQFTRCLEAERSISSSDFLQPKARPIPSEKERKTSPERFLPHVTLKRLAVPCFPSRNLTLKRLLLLDGQEVRAASRRRPMLSISIRNERSTAGSSMSRAVRGRRGSKSRSSTMPSTPERRQKTKGRATSVSRPLNHYWSQNSPVISYPSYEDEASKTFERSNMTTTTASATPVSVRPYSTSSAFTSSRQRYGGSSSTSRGQASSAGFNSRTPTLSSPALTEDRSSPAAGIRPRSDAFANLTTDSNRRYYGDEALSSVQGNSLGSPSTMWVGRNPHQLLIDDRHYTWHNIRPDVPDPIRGSTHKADFAAFKPNVRSTPPSSRTSAVTRPAQRSEVDRKPSLPEVIRSPYTDGYRFKRSGWAPGSAVDTDTLRPLKGRVFHGGSKSVCPAEEKVSMATMSPDQKSPPLASSPAAGVSDLVAPDVTASGSLRRRRRSPSQFSSSASQLPKQTQSPSSRYYESHLRRRSHVQRRKSRGSSRASSYLDSEKAISASCPPCPPCPPITCPPCPPCPPSASTQYASGSATPSSVGAETSKSARLLLGGIKDLMVPLSCKSHGEDTVAGSPGSAHSLMMPTPAQLCPDGMQQVSFIGTRSTRASSHKSGNHHPDGQYAVTQTRSPAASNKGSMKGPDHDSNSRTETAAPSTTSMPPVSTSSYPCSEQRRTSIAMGNRMMKGPDIFVSHRDTNRVHEGSSRGTGYSVSQASTVMPFLATSAPASPALSYSCKEQPTSVSEVTGRSQNGSFSPPLHPKTTLGSKSANEPQHSSSKAKTLTPLLGSSRPLATPAQICLEMRSRRSKRPSEYSFNQVLSRDPCKLPESDSTTEQEEGLQEAAVKFLQGILGIRGESSLACSPKPCRHPCSSIFYFKNSSAVKIKGRQTNESDAGKGCAVHALSSECIWPCPGRPAPKLSSSDLCFDSWDVSAFEESPVQAECPPVRQDTIECQQVTGCVGVASANEMCAMYRAAEAGCLKAGGEISKRRSENPSECCSASPQLHTGNRSSSSLIPSLSSQQRCGAKSPSTSQSSHLHPAINESASQSNYCWSQLRQTKQCNSAISARKPTQPRTRAVRRTIQTPAQRLSNSGQLLKDSSDVRKGRHSTFSAGCQPPMHSCSISTSTPSDPCGSFKAELCSSSGSDPCALSSPEYTKPSKPTIRKKPRCKKPTQLPAVCKGAVYITEMESCDNEQAPPSEEQVCDEQVLHYEDQLCDEQQTPQPVDEEGCDEQEATCAEKESLNEHCDAEGSTTAVDESDVLFILEQSGYAEEFEEGTLSSNPKSAHSQLKATKSTKSCSKTETSSNGKIPPAKRGEAPGVSRATSRTATARSDKCLSMTTASQSNKSVSMSTVPKSDKSISMSTASRCHKSIAMSSASKNNKSVSMSTTQRCDKSIAMSTASRSNKSISMSTASRSNKSVSMSTTQRCDKSIAMSALKSDKCLSKSSAKTSSKHLTQTALDHFKASPIKPASCKTSVSFSPSTGASQVPSASKSQPIKTAKVGILNTSSTSAAEMPTAQSVTVTVKKSCNEAAADATKSKSPQPSMKVPEGKKPWRTPVKPPMKAQETQTPSIPTRSEVGTMPDMQVDDLMAELSATSPEEEASPAKLSKHMDTQTTLPEVKYSRKARKGGKTCKQVEQETCKNGPSLPCEIDEGFHFCASPLPEIKGKICPAQKPLQRPSCLTKKPCSNTCGSQSQRVSCHTLGSQPDPCVSDSSSNFDYGNISGFLQDCKLSGKKLCCLNTAPRNRCIHNSLWSNIFDAAHIEASRKEVMKCCIPSHTSYSRSRRKPHKPLKLLTDMALELAGNGYKKKHEKKFKS